MDAINSQRNPTKISHSLATQKPTQTMEETIHTAVITVTSATEPMTSSPNVGVTADELVAKSIAPVKREYLRPTTVRPDDGRSERKPAGNSAVITKEKKSKRQLKRDRQQEKKAAPHICPEVAKRGDANSCPYKDKCRFSHDVDAFKAQKPEDLEGECPFMIDEAPCPYGLSCRFLGKHKDGVSSEITNGRKIGCELNGLSKDVQKLLWKNKLKFEKADAQLKRLGLMGPKNKILQEKDEGDQTTQNGTVPDKNGSHEVSGDVNNQSNPCTEIMEENDNTASAVVPDELRPPKKAKSSPDENPCHVKTDNGVDNMEEVCPREESELKDDCISTVETDKSLQFHSRERKLIDFREKLYLAPLTTVGNLPFRRVCKVLGADITCGEMAMCTNLLQGQASEWALLRRHSSEDIFGVQICGAYPDTVSKTVELIEKECTVDFIDINMGCPIDIVVSKGAGSALLTKPMRMKGVIQAASATVDTPVTVKVRTGYLEGRNRIDSLIEDIGKWGATALTIHGRSRQQRYSKLADWDYIYQCTRNAPDSLQVLGNGDVFSYVDWNTHKSDCPEISTCMIARGALIKNLKWSFGRKHIRLHRKGLPVLLAESIGTISVATETITYTNFSLSWDHSPWLFTEIKEQRHWDISSGERLDILKDYVRFGLQHWGSDSKGVETTRHFLLEWLSYTYRYVPVGLLDVIPQRLNWRSPSYFGRDDLETLMASDSAADWIRISELLLGKVPASFTFSPKHKSNAYDKAENG